MKYQGVLSWIGFVCLYCSCSLCVPQGVIATATTAPSVIVVDGVHHGGGRGTPSVYDVVILGSGPAGLTAALFAARAGLYVLVLGSDAGSSLSEAIYLDNFPGFGSLEDGENTTDHPVHSKEDNLLVEDDDEFGGSAWLRHAKRKAMNAGANFAQAGLLASHLKRLPSTPEVPGTFQIDIDAQRNNNNNESRPLNVRSRSVILAMGAMGQRLGLKPLEDELGGKSIHSCAVCDGNSYVDQIVLVVGGGDAAVDAALMLARYAKRVIVVHRRLEFRASHQRNVELLHNTDNIMVVTPFVVKELNVIRGKDNQSESTLTGVLLKNTKTDEEQNVHCDGIFVMIGSKPNTMWLKGIGGPVELQLDSNGYVMIDQNQRNTYSQATTVSGIFVAGEATDQMYRQAITAAAEGAQAAMDAERWLRTQSYATSNDLRNIVEQPQQQIPLQNKATTATQHQRLRVRGSDRAAVTGEHRNLQDEHDQQQHRDMPAITCDLSQVECLHQVVHEHSLVIFSKPRCPQCQQLLETLALEGLSWDHPEVNIINVSKLGTSKANKIRTALKEMTGKKSFPSIFLEGAWVGGEAETRKWHESGKLKNMLVKAGLFGVGEGVNDGLEEL